MKKYLNVTNIGSLALLAAYNNTPGWKVDENGALVLKDGNPVYVDASGREMSVDQNTISSRNNEAKEWRIKYEAAEAALAPFKGLDPVKAKEAIELAGKIDAKTLIEAGKVDEVKQQITQQFTGQLQEKDKAYNELQSKFENLLIGDVFKGSEFVRDNLAVPRDMFEATFRNNFKVEDGKVVAYDKAGNRMYSKSKMGEFADPEEAIQLLVEMHPQKDAIIKANTGAGSGNNGGGGSRQVGSKVIKRSEFNNLDPAQQADIALKAGRKEISIVD